MSIIPTFIFALIFLIALDKEWNYLALISLGCTVCFFVNGMRII